MKRRIGKPGLVLALAATFLALQGCGAVGRYFQYRYHDFTQMVDGGITFSIKPGIGLYWNSLDLLVAGYSNIDGYFLGWGGNQIGFTRVYSNCYGLIVSKERVGWGDFDKDDDSTLFVRYGGLGGLASLATGGGPDYTPACVHFFPHIGFVGIVWNARWTQIADFILGWTTIDIDGDDGYKFGKWVWQKRTRLERNVAEPVEVVDADATARPAARREAVQRQTEPAPRSEPAAVPDRGTGITLTVRHDAIPRREETPTVAAPALPPALPDVRSRAPESDQATSEPATVRTYTVQPGDTLYGIARRFYGNGNRWKDILAANPETVPNERALQAGAVLLIP